MFAILRAVARYLVTGLKLMGHSHLYAWPQLVEPEPTPMPTPSLEPEPTPTPSPSPSLEPEPSFEDEHLRPRTMAR